LFLIGTNTCHRRNGGGGYAARDATESFGVGLGPSKRACAC